MIGRAGAQPKSAVPPSPDRMMHPPLRREFSSPEGTFLLEVESTDGWKTFYPTARLFRTVTASRVLCWSRVLPHQYGPRSAVVADDGHVLFADEWINVASRWALMLLDVDNRVIATHDFKAVVAALGATLAEVSAKARYGTWITDGPTLAPDGKSARILAGGRAMAISLSDGRLSLMP